MGIHAIENTYFLLRRLLYIVYKSIGLVWQLFYKNKGCHLTHKSMGIDWSTANSEYKKADFQKYANILCNLPTNLLAEVGHPISYSYQKAEFQKILNKKYANILCNFHNYEKQKIEMA